MNDMRASQVNTPQSGNWYYFYFTPPALLVGRSGFDDR